MNILEGFILGVLQGLAEFLPISSSGHLVIGQQLLGLAEPQLTFEIVVHFATLFSIIFYFKKQLLALKLEDLKLLLIASIPAGLVGIFFRMQIQQAFSSVNLVALALVVTGILNLVVDRYLQKAPGRKTLDVRSALVIGFAQALAILPGISRSGTTIGAGVLQGVDRERAFSFSFLLSIPAVIGAMLLEVLSANQGMSIITPAMLAGALSAFVVGLLSLKLFHKIIRRARLEVFGWYCLALGLLVLVLRF